MAAASVLQRHPIATLCLIVSLAGLHACDDNADGGAQAPDFEQQPGDNDDETGVRVDRYGVGSNWYDYDGATHVVTPSDISWLIVDGEARHELQITSYYDDFGVSGTPQLRVREQGGEWSTIRAATNVKNESWCASLPTLETVPCTASSELVFRTDRRSLLEAGFAVTNPAVYLTPSADVVSYYGPRDLVAAALESGNTAELFAATSPLRNERPPALGDLAYSGVQQLAADMRIAQWHLDDSAGTLQLSARCVVAATSPASNADLTGAYNTLAFNVLPADGFVLVDLCGEAGPEVVGDIESFGPGNWPANSTFDLVFRRAGSGELTVLLSPENAAFAAEFSEEPFTPNPLFWTLVY